MVPIGTAPSTQPAKAPAPHGWPVNAQSKVNVAGVVVVSSWYSVPQPCPPFRGLLAEHGPDACTAPALVVPTKIPGLTSSTSPNGNSPMGNTLGVGSGKIVTNWY